MQHLKMDAAAKYLKKLRYMDDALKALENNIADAKERAEIVGYDMSKQRVSGTNSKDMADAVARMDELKETWAAKYLEYSTEYERMRNACDATHFDRWVCWLHYVEGWEWSRLAKKFCYSSHHIMRRESNRTHGAGLLQIHEILPPRYKVS